jgi:hypothetical protein
VDQVVVVDVYIPALAATFIPAVAAAAGEGRFA